MTLAARFPMEGTAMALERELETCRRELPALLSDPANRGKHALVYGDKVYGVWDTVDAALTAGYEAFQLEPFLVKEVVEHERPRHFSRNVSRCPRLLAKSIGTEPSYPFASG